MSRYRLEIEGEGGEMTVINYGTDHALGRWLDARVGRRLRLAVDRTTDPDNSVKGILGALVRASIITAEDIERARGLLLVLPEVPVEENNGVLVAAEILSNLGRD